MSHTFSYSIFPLGDTALTIDFGNHMEECINNHVHAAFYKLQQLHLPYILAMVPAYSSLSIHYNVAAILEETENDQTAFETMASLIEHTISIQQEVPPPRRHTIKIPVCYAEKYALDIADMAKYGNLSVPEIINLHTSKKYRVYMIGFLPGFAYMGTVDERLAMPRKAQPRTKVEAGAVGIAGSQTGIYPFASPGGWQIIGKTPIQLFNRQKENPVLLTAGDEVEFYSISQNEFENY
jgi:inhibitor of KinA